MPSFWPAARVTPVRLRRSAIRAHVVLHQRLLEERELERQEPAHEPLGARIVEVAVAVDVEIRAVADRLAHRAYARDVLVDHLSQRPRVATRCNAPAPTTIFRCWKPCATIAFATATSSSRLRNAGPNVT